MNPADYNEIIFDASNGRISMQSSCQVQASVLRSMFDDDSLCDVTLSGVRTAGMQPTSLCPVKAYKVVLAHASSHLHDLLTIDGYVDSHMSHYDIANVDHESLRRIVEFIHTDKLVMDENEAVDAACGIIIGAKYLVMKNRLADACESFLAKGRVNLDNCIKLWCFARKYSCLMLMEVTSKFITENLNVMPESDAFLNMPYTDIAKLLLSEALVAANGDVRCRAAFAWLDHGCDGSRVNYVHDVLNMVPLTSDPLLTDTILEANKYEILVKHAPDLLRLAMVNALKKIKLDHSALPVVPFCGRCSMSRHTWYVMGGSPNDTQFLKYDVVGRLWTTLPALPWKRTRSAACATDDRLIVMGGLKNGSASTDVDEYNVASCLWSTSVAKLIQARFDLTACSSNQDAYAVGGFQRKFFDVMEHYSPVTVAVGSSQTVRLSPLPSARKDLAALFLTSHNSILTAGGYDGNAGNLSGIDKYDVASDTWTKVGDLTQARCMLASVIAGNEDELYSIGGWGNGMCTGLSTVDIFNVRTGQTRSAPAVLSSRYGCSAVTMFRGNVVAVLGGCSETCAVETYDVREGKWFAGIVVPDMPVPRGGFGFAAV